MNILDFIKKHKNETFHDFAFTEVDNLILSIIPYLNLDDVVLQDKIYLKDAYSLYQKKKRNERGIFNHSAKDMFALMSTTKRYQNIFLYHYERIVNEEMQFGAITCKLDTNDIYIAFAGTDSSIIGWEEDFKLAYLYPGISQKYAANYLKRTIKLFDHHVMVGGHSKGGNLAISAVMLSNYFIRSKVKIIYNNDGPGFLKEQIDSKEYKKIEHKIKMYVPEDSIIGMLLYHTLNYTVVKARGFNILEHDAFHWIVNDTKFVQDKQTKRSKNLEKKITKKIEELPISKRTKLVNDLFQIFKSNKITNTKDITLKNIIKLLKDFQELDEDTRHLITEFMMLIFIK